MIRILFVDQNDFIGGGQFQLFYIIKKIISVSGMRISFLFSINNSLYNKFLNNSKIKCFFLTNSRLKRKTIFIYNLKLFFSVLVQLHKIIAKEKIQLIYTASTLTVFASLFFKSFYPVKVIFARMHAQRTNKIFSIFLKLIFNNTDGIIYNSQYTKIFHEGFFKIKSNVKNVISYSIVKDPVPKLSYKSQEYLFMERLKKDNDFLIGYVGRISPNKNVHLFVEVAKYLLINHPKCSYKFLIIGAADPRFPQYYDKVVELSNTVDDGSFLILDFQENIFDIIASLDLLVQLTYGEAFGRVILEAALLNVPILVSAPSGAEEIVKHLSLGKSIYSNRIEDIASSVLEMLSLKGINNDIGKLLRLFDPDKLVNREILLLRNIIGQPINDLS